MHAREKDPARETEMGRPWEPRAFLNCHQNTPSMGSWEYPEVTRSKETHNLVLSLTLCGAVYCLAVLVICDSIQSPPLSPGLSIFICNMKRLDQMTSKFPLKCLTQIVWVYCCGKANENVRSDFMVLDILGASILLKIEDSAVWVISLPSYHSNLFWKIAYTILFPPGGFREASRSANTAKRVWIQEQELIDALASEPKDWLGPHRGDWTEGLVTLAIERTKLNLMRSWTWRIWINNTIIITLYWMLAICQTLCEALSKNLI